MGEKTLERPVEKSAEAAPSGKLILFNYSKNPYHLKDGPNGEKRIFAVGSSLECADRAEYDQLKKYKGMNTTQQFAPGLNTHIIKLEAEKAALVDEVAELKKQVERYQKGK